MGELLVGLARVPLDRDEIGLEAGQGAQVIGASSTSAPAGSVSSCSGSGRTANRARVPDRLDSTTRVVAARGVRPDGLAGRHDDVVDAPDLATPACSRRRVRCRSEGVAARRPAARRPGCRTPGSTIRAARSRRAPQRLYRPCGGRPRRVRPCDIRSNRPDDSSTVRSVGNVWGYGAGRPSQSADAHRRAAARTPPRIVEGVVPARARAVLRADVTTSRVRSGPRRTPTSAGWRCHRRSAARSTSTS